MKKNDYDELYILKKELAFQNEEKENRAAELLIANVELAFQKIEKENRAAELLIANIELAFQNEEKEKRVTELAIANKIFAFQNVEKEKRAAELVIANKELAYQNIEKESRAVELAVANKELAFQNVEREKRAAELMIANKELAFENIEKERRAAELAIANKELAFQNAEKESRAAELVIANKELAYQNIEKESRAAELAIANKELAFQNVEKEKRAAELMLANKELEFENIEKESRAAELVIANRELAFQNEEKEIRIATNRDLQLSNERLIATQQDLNNTVKWLRESEIKLHSIIAQAPVAIATFQGPEFVIEEFNEKVLEYWGRSAEQVKNIPLFSALPEASGQGFEELLTNVLKTGESLVANELPVTLLRNGILDKTWINFIYEPLKNNSGHIIGIIVVCVEVTDQVNARKGLELMLQQKDDFINVASHELKTPVTSLKASLQVLNRMKDKLPPVILSKLIEQSAKSLQKLIILINDLLNTNRIVQGQLQLVKDTVTVADMINNCCSNIHDENKHHFILEGNTDCQIHADEHQIEQVITNLISNAIKYAPDAPEIIIKAEKMAAALKISIKDKGLGIQPEKLPYLFDRYYRADHNSIQYSGLGLGLYISSEIIKKHGGEIGADSEPGKGSTFWFTLPLI
jgi:signal transduction histidine kinase